MLLELECGDRPEAWAALGFALPVRVGPVALSLDGRGGGIRGWTLRGEGPPELDGIPTRWRARGDGLVGERALDHVVVLTDDRDRTSSALVEAGGDERRRIEAPAPISFVRFGDVVVEVAQAGGPTRIWGVTAVVEDLGELPADLVGAPRDAVQPGRRIATVRPEAGLGTAVAFMTPRVRTR